MVVISTLACRFFFYRADNKMVRPKGRPSAHAVEGRHFRKKLNFVCSWVGRRSSLAQPWRAERLGMQRVPFCLKEPKCNLLAPASNSENWANMLPWHLEQEHAKEGLYAPSAQKGGDKGLLKPENLRKKCVPTRARWRHKLASLGFWSCSHHRHGYSKSA